MSGYDIKRSLQRFSWLIGSPSFGSLYPALHALLEDNLVTVEVVSREDKPPRKVYSITEAGGRALQEWINRPVETDASLKTFVMCLFLASSFPQAGLIAHLQNRRAQVADQHAALEQAVETADKEGGLEQRLALGYGLAIAAAELAWLDSTLDWLPQQSLPVEVVQGDNVLLR
jgi:PadR family transcriptional regulator AphA